MDYSKYIQSKEWQDVKHRHRDAGLSDECLNCGTKEGITLHHRTYSRLGCERLTDLLPLCWVCHKKIHDYSEKHGIKLGQFHIALSRMNSWSKEYVRFKLSKYYLAKSFKLKKLKKKKKKTRTKKSHWSDAFKEFPEDKHLRFHR
jgi:hypothetical protein